VKSKLECIPCLLRQSLNAAKIVTDDPVVQENVLKSVMRELLEMPLSYTPPLIARTTYGIVSEITGCEDPYREIKATYNEVAMGMYPRLKEIVDESDDRLLTATKLAIAGNIIDFGADIRFNIEETINDTLTREFAINDYSEFVKSLVGSETILYLSDNAGEVVFDRVLLEEIRNCADIVYAVKKKPIINDAMTDDAIFCGIDSIAEIVTTADTPGTILERCDPEFVDLFRSADLIVSKGQGNYESLSEESGNIFFMLLVKCPVIADDLGIKMWDAVLKRK